LDFGVQASAWSQHAKAWAPETIGAQTLVCEFPQFLKVCYNKIKLKLPR